MERWIITMAETMSFHQVATIMNSIHNQVTGVSAPVATDTKDFVEQATTTLAVGRDPIMNAISQVLGKTIFSIRSYDRKFRGLEVTNQRWGNHTRKLQMGDGPVEDDERYKLQNGKSTDMYIVNEPDVLQTNFYGQSVFQKHVTIFKNQLDNAFTGPDELGSFFAMVMSNISNNIEQNYEQMARLTIANLIAAITLETTSATQRVVKLVSRYNTFLGLTGEQVKTYAEIKANPSTYEQFIRWCFATIDSISRSMTERTAMYHTNIPFEVSNVTLLRHTPLRYQRMYFYQPFLNEINALVKSVTFNSEFLRLADYESVNFWQSPKEPGTINVKASYTNGLGTTSTGTFNNPNVVGILMDVEAAGMNIFNTWTANTPINASGGYYNMFYHWTIRWWNDLTENAVVFLLE